MVALLPVVSGREAINSFAYILSTFSNENKDWKALRNYALHVLEASPHPKDIYDRLDDLLITIKDSSLSSDYIDEKLVLSATSKDGKPLLSLCGSSLYWMIIVFPIEQISQEEFKQCVSAGVSEITFQRMYSMN